MNDFTFWKIETFLNVSTFSGVWRFYFLISQKKECIENGRYPLPLYYIVTQALWSVHIKWLSSSIENNCCLLPLYSPTELLFCNLFPTPRKAMIWHFWIARRTQRSTRSEDRVHYQRNRQECTLIVARHAESVVPRATRALFSLSCPPSRSSKCLPREVRIGVGIRVGVGLGIEDTFSNKIRRKKGKNVEKVSVSRILFIFLMFLYYNYAMS